MRDSPMNAIQEYSGCGSIYPVSNLVPNKPLQESINIIDLKLKQSTYHRGDTYPE